MEGGSLNRTERFLRSCRGEPVDRPPVWLMRQAGRYLPEYRAVRGEQSFLDVCRDVDRAVEISLQPLRLVGTEAVILFSDIFVPIPGMGVEVDFKPGPIIAEPIRSLAQAEALRVPDPRESVPYVFEILRALRRELASEAVPLIGFAGAPFTLAAYLVEGRSSTEFGAVKRMMHRAPEVLRALLARLTDLVVAHLAAQVEAGAQAVQIFDTWAGMLAPVDYREWVLPVHREIASRLERATGSPAGEVGPDSRAPLILYVKGGAHVVDSMVESGADVISLDWRVDLARAAREAGGRVSLQGNLDPAALVAPRERIIAWVREMAEAAAPARGYIVNLGHGCTPDTPVEGVRAFTDAVRALASAPGRRAAAPS
jgi:uroporphyrinogen decarboxylase